MFRIIKFDSLLKVVALLTVVLSMSIYWLVQSRWLADLPMFTVVTISSLVSGAIIFILFTGKISRGLWWIYGCLDKSVYPDLNGSWEGEIVPSTGDGPIVARAVIRQTIASTQIDMHGATNKSITLETTPTIEQGQKKLYYSYRSTPKNPDWATYNGSTQFDVRVVKSENGNTLELSGIYYTDRKTNGRIRLAQVSKDSNSDVSFY